MRIISKTIFSNSPLRTTEEIETKKISYWLEKLFNQAKDKGKIVLEEQPKTQTDDPKTEQTSEEKGLAEAVKSHAGKAEKNRQAVEDMVNNSNRILVKISSVFPLEFFPTSI